MSQVVSGQKQAKTGLAESHQIKRISKKEMRIKGSPLLFWMLNVRQEGKESKTRSYCSITRWVGKQNSILKLALDSLGGGGRRHLKYNLNVLCAWAQP